jgi:hypothetical protein
MFLAGGVGNKVTSSYYGDQWMVDTPNLAPFGGTANIRCITYGAGKYIATSDNFYLAYSLSGIDQWEIVKNNPFKNTNILAIAYGGGKFVAGGYGGKIAWSTDGVNWTAIGSPLGSGAARALAARSTP